MRPTQQQRMIQFPRHCLGFQRLCQLARHCLANLMVSIPVEQVKAAHIFEITQGKAFAKVKSQVPKIFEDRIGASLLRDWLLLEFGI